MIFENNLFLYLFVCLFFFLQVKALKRKWKEAKLIKQLEAEKKKIQEHEAKKAKLEKEEDDRLKIGMICALKSSSSENLLLDAENFM